MMPNREEISLTALYGETEDEIQQARAGEQVRIRIKGIEEEDISLGCKTPEVATVHGYLLIRFLI